MTRWTALVCVGWIAAAAASVSLAMGALHIVGADILNLTVAPLTPERVASELAASPDAPPPASACPTCGQPVPSPSPSAATSPSPSPATPSSPQATRTPDRRSSTRATSPVPATRSLTTPGGTVVATCSNDLSRLLSWSPGQGYQVGAVVAGPAPIASLVFRRGGDDDVAWRTSVTCVNGTPSATTDRISWDD